MRTDGPGLHTAECAIPCKSAHLTQAHDLRPKVRNVAVSARPEARWCDPRVPGSARVDLPPRNSTQQGRKGEYFTRSADALRRQAGLQHVPISAPGMTPKMVEAEKE